MPTTHTRPASSPEPASRRFPVAGPEPRSVEPERRAFPAAGPATAPVELPTPSGGSFRAPERMARVSAESAPQGS